MPLNIDSEEVTRLAETLASRTGVSETEAVRVALTNELERREGTKANLSARIREIQDRVAAYPPTGLKADKAFYDGLNDE